MPSIIIAPNEFVVLKNQFAAATDFAEFWTGFLEHFAARPGFMQLGAPAEVDGMEILICRLASHIVGELVEPVNTKLIKIPEAGLVHGSCLIREQLCCIVFFEDLEMGLLVLMSESGKTHYSRFTLRGKNQA